MRDSDVLTYDWRSWLRTALATAVLCAAIAVVTRYMNGHSYWLNLWISLGYGLSIVGSLSAITYWKPDWPDWISNILALILGVTLGMTNLAFAMALMGELDRLLGDSSVLASNLWIGLFFGGIGLLFFYALYRLQALRAEVSERRRQEAEHARALTLSKLKVVQSQMEPHFLFNTLANVQALIGEEPKRAADMLQALTEMLRVNLNRVRSDTTQLGDELAIARNYLAIQSIRMGDRLSYRIDIPESLHAMPMPPLLLQPLIENAVRHGIEPKSEGGEIRIWSEVRTSGDDRGQQLGLHVSDNGLGMEASGATQGEGVGLANVRQRLEHLYGESACLRMQPGAQGGMLVSLMMPVAQSATDDLSEVSR